MDDKGFDKLKEIKEAQADLNKALDTLSEEGRGFFPKQLHTEVIKKNEKLLQLLQDYKQANGEKE